MKPKLVQYEGRTVMQVPIEWQGSHLLTLMDGVKLVALLSPHEPLSSGYNFLWD
jgi:hypothetical protein